MMIIEERKRELNMPPRKIKKYDGKKYFSTAEAAEYTGMATQTFRYHAFTSKRILGVLIGTSRVFTREELNDYVANDNWTRTTSGRLDLPDAAVYLAMSEEGIKTAVDEGRLPATVYGGNMIFTPEQLDDFHHNGGRTEKKAVPPFLSTSEAADFADMTEEALRQNIWRGSLTAIKVGLNRVIERKTLIEFIDTKRDRGRPKGSD